MNISMCEVKKCFFRHTKCPLGKLVHCRLSQKLTTVGVYRKEVA